jgi:hypothetical protein
MFSTGPMPERSRILNVLKTPAERITRPVPGVTITLPVKPPGPVLSNSTPVATPLSRRTRVTLVFMRSVNVSRCA